ncbi:rhodanese-like domain-containing protein [Oceanisphaera marina]|uniref:Rhodanese-like domain-containing protein n=1 Tax=Oceanisphaera marina TaxID=2017550 RepID=A0ABQ1IH71_9GAMM|nr:rhodanese-like domain-containing protein [Oceanisphaera marina]GGB40506.1 rhodanese-like domain-containing protein [Oceanisphaera marina]
MQEYLEFFTDNTMLVLVWCGLVIAIIAMTLLSKLSKVRIVVTQEAVALINKQDAVVIDVRSAEDFRKGHIAGAINVPAAQLKANNLNLIQKYQKKPIVLVCETGVTTNGIGRLLTKADFEQVHALRGGMADWRTQNLPVTKR